MGGSFPFSVGGWGWTHFFFFQTLSVPSFPPYFSQPPPPGAEVRAATVKPEEWTESSDLKGALRQTSDTIWPGEELESSSRLCVIPLALLFVPNTSAIELPYSLKDLPLRRVHCLPTPYREEQRAEWLEPPSPKPRVDRDPSPPRQADGYLQFTARNFPPGLSWWSSG